MIIWAGSDGTNTGGLYYSYTAYTIGGTVAGLAAGNSVVLQNNAGDDLSVDANGGFTFAMPVADGDGYAVTVLTQPVNPRQFCRVANGNGTVPGADVTNVSVICVISDFSWNLFLPAIIR